MARKPPSKLDDLIARLLKATEARGKRTELARDLKVPLPRLSEWLNKASAPGGETTLRLLAWVQKQEKKNTKAADDATNTVSDGTRSTGVTYEETHKAGPRKP